jgi:hypothetical protein
MARYGFERSPIYGKPPTRLPSAPRPGLQPRQGCADPGDAEDGAVVADRPAGKALIKIGAKVVNHRRYVAFQNGRGRDVPDDVSGDQVAHRLTCEHRPCRHAREMEAE